MRELLAPVRPLLQCAQEGGERLRPTGRVCVRLAVRLARRVVQDIEARGCDSITRRAKMFDWRVVGVWLGCGTAPACHANVRVPAGRRRGVVGARGL